LDKLLTKPCKMGTSEPKRGSCTS